METVRDCKRYQKELKWAKDVISKDKDLLEAIYDGELLVEPITQSMTTLWTRKDKVIEDETPNMSIIMPNSDEHSFFRLNEQ